MIISYQVEHSHLLLSLTKILDDIRECYTLRLNRVKLIFDTGVLNRLKNPLVSLLTDLVKIAILNLGKCDIDDDVDGSKGPNISPEISLEPILL